MNIQDIFHVTDQLFSEGKAESAVALLEKELAAVRAEGCTTCCGEGNWRAELSLLNELMGYYRSTKQLDRAWPYANRVVEILDQHQMLHSLDGATVQLNVATVYRDAGQPGMALSIYESIEKFYLENGMERDIRLIALYNNMSVASMDLNDIDKAYAYGMKALSRIERSADTAGERATILGNLAGLLMRKEERDWETIDGYLDEAIHLFETQAAHDPHAGFVFATKANACEVRDDLQNALKYYEAAAAVMERSFGRNEHYQYFTEKCARLRGMA